MKMLDLLNKAITMNEENLLEQKNNLQYKLKHKHYSAPYQKEKDIKRFERIKARLLESKNLMYEIGKKNLELFATTYNMSLKTENNIRWMMEEIQNHNIDDISDEHCKTIINLINSELKKRRNVKLNHLLNYTWNLNEADFYNIYFVKTLKFKKFIEELQIDVSSGFSFDKVEETDNQFLYFQDIQHLIEGLPSNIDDSKFKIILKEYYINYVESRKGFRKNFTYDEVFKFIFKEQNVNES